MGTVVAVLLLVVGVGYPIMGMMALNRRLNRKPAPQPRLIGLWLAFNGIMPVTLVFAAFALLSPRMWESLSFRLALAFVAVVAVALLAGLGWETRRRQAEEARDGRDNSRAGV